LQLEMLIEPNYNKQMWGTLWVTLWGTIICAKFILISDELDN